MNPPRRRPVPLPTWSAWLLAGALLLAQSLGWVHRVAHGTPGFGAQATTWGADHESGGATCRLVDQLAHADLSCAPPAPAVAVLAWSPAPVLASAPAVFGGTPHRYDARGPPAA